MDKPLHDTIVKKLTDSGQLLSAAFEEIRFTYLPMDATADQIRVMHIIFMLGAQHLFASVLSMLDHGSEATENDMRRMMLVDNELRAFFHKTANDDIMN